VQDLQLLAINLTQRCNLACEHCYLDASTLQHGAGDELTTAEVYSLLDDVAALDSGTMIVLTGGEPLLRKDVEAIVSHGAKAGLPMVLGTNGMMLTATRIKSLKAAGLLGVGISIDSLQAEQHDAFRGRSGSWLKTMSAIERCRNMGLEFQIHFSVTRQNSEELEDLVDFCRAVGARVLNIFFLVCTGRGESMTDISPAKYDEVIERIIWVQKNTTDLIIRPRCAPHYKRIAHQLEPESALNRISGMDGDGCIAGVHYARVNATGGVTACPYMESEAGNIRRVKFSTVWRDAEEFESLRHPQLKGKCGSCEYQRLCGGCRARPVAAGNDLMDSDPTCQWLPNGGAVIVPLSLVAGNDVSWHTDATRRLERIPSFLRRLVRKRAEQYVIELGEKQVTPDHLSRLAAARFGTNKPGRPGS
jgi:radical SAM protein with 4Fe4S-binding SPASM domain